jgi:hypothetical protein
LAIAGNQKSGYDGGVAPDARRRVRICASASLVLFGSVEWSWAEKPHSDLTETWPKWSKRAGRGGPKSANCFLRHAHGKALESLD